mmetsp:Transcript_16333/g.37600  ORF Transcript_16333/g.37600 Transcript_16333/m.37600 type:complete len:135 (-) Transcript_16333:61-465(-)
MNIRVSIAYRADPVFSNTTAPIRYETETVRPMRCDGKNPDQRFRQETHSNSIPGNEQHQRLKDCRHVNGSSHRRATKKPGRSRYVMIHPKTDSCGMHRSFFSNETKTAFTNAVAIAERAVIHIFLHERENESIR